MVDFLLLGNGYDLNYKLPTSYRNFLLTVNFLVEQKIDRIHSIGDVFGNRALNSQDKFIKDSYEFYRTTYDKVLLDSEKIEELVTLAKNNIWLNYFNRSFKRDAGWIDFEKEIAFVVGCFQSFFSKADVNFLPNSTFETDSSKYIILDAMNFFVLDEDITSKRFPTGFRRISPDYILEHPMGSHNFVIHKDKIVTYLNDMLHKFSKMLQIYLHCFIENTVAKLVEESQISGLRDLGQPYRIITFNYTNTYEQINPGSQVEHIHGEAQDKIVLGISPDKNDYLGTVNTDFLPFKKFFQRVFYQTDIGYLSLMASRKDPMRPTIPYKLTVMGHSLDETDQDIIKELFREASRINILYHDIDKVPELIKNLVKIFGKEEFDLLRLEKGLDFNPQMTNFELDSLRKQVVTQLSVGK